MSKTTTMDLIKSLRSTKCPSCSSRKKPHQTLCGGCYRLIPRAAQQALYNRVGEGYEEAFEAAMTHLGVDTPAIPKGEK